jgi:hypothetical protein
MHERPMLMAACAVLQKLTPSAKLRLSTSL